MKETFALVTAGFCTAVGVVAAAQGAFVQGLFYGSVVLVMLGALWFFNRELFA